VAEGSPEPRALKLGRAAMVVLPLSTLHLLAGPCFPPWSTGFFLAN
jgi:hypothetical protein